MTTETHWAVTTGKQVCRAILWIAVALAKVMVWITFVTIVFTISVMSGLLRSGQSRSVRNPHAVSRRPFC